MVARSLLHPPVTTDSHARSVGGFAGSATTASETVQAIHEAANGMQELADALLAANGANAT